MRIIGVFATCIVLAACATPPIFPPEITSDVEMDTFDFGAWQKRSNSPSSADFVPHKVELGGQIVRAVRTPKGTIILADEQPVDRYLEYGSTSGSPRKSTFRFLIVFLGDLDPGMLQIDNKLAVVGIMDGAGRETIGEPPRVLPSLIAQCLHIWKTEASKTHVFVFTGSGYYPVEGQTFCLEENTVKSPCPPVTVETMRGSVRQDRKRKGVNQSRCESVHNLSNLSAFSGILFSNLRHRSP